MTTKPAETVSARSAGSVSNVARADSVASGETFRNVFGAFPTGVTIVTTCDEVGLPVGMTVNAVSALSLDPPQLLVCLQRGKYTLAAIRDCGHFAVNFLSHDQSPLSARFASARLDKFAEVQWSPGVQTGVPCLDGVIAVAECGVSDVIISGDHEIVVGTMIAGQSREGAALVYWNRDYHRLVRQGD